MQLLQQLQEIVIKLICARRMNADDILAHLCSVIKKKIYQRSSISMQWNNNNKH